MHGLTVLLVLSLILPGLCITPADYGFTANEDGTFSKEVGDTDGRGSFFVVMRIDGNGKAYYNIDGDVGKDVAVTTKNHYVVGNRLYPIYGWKVPEPSVTGPVTGYAAAKTGWGATVDTTGRIQGAFNTGNYGQNTNPNLPLAPTYQNVKPNLNLAPTYQNSKPNVPLASSLKNSGANVAIVPIGQPINGKYYTVDIRRERKVGQCTDRIVIRGATIMPTSAILAEFQPQCEDGARKFRADGEELLVGGVEQNLCVYGHIDLPKQLVVIENGNCVIKNYDGRIKKVDDLNTDICVKVKELVENIQYALENPAIVRNGVAQNNEQQLNELVKMAVSGRGHSPVDFGFAANRDGSYSKQVAKRNARGFYFLIMTIDRAGKADFRLGNSYSKDVGTIRGNYYKLGDTAFPIYGWQVPSVKQSGPSALNTRPMTGNNNAGSYYGQKSRPVPSLAIPDQNRKINTQNVVPSAPNQPSATKGNYYTVNVRRDRSNGQCTDNIIIRGVNIMPTSVILAEFNPQCNGVVVRGVNVNGDDLLVGGVEQNLCVYGHIDFPNKLIVIQDGNCVVKTYDGKSGTEEPMDTVTCGNVKDIIKDIANEKKNPTSGNGDSQNIQQSKKQLVGMILGWQTPDLKFNSPSPLMAPALSSAPGYSKVPVMSPAHVSAPDYSQVPVILPPALSSTTGNTQMVGSQNSGVGGTYSVGDAFPKSRFSVGAPLLFSPEYITSDARENVDYGTVFNVRIIQYSGNNGGCEEEVMIVSKDKSLKKTLYTKCLIDGKIRKIRNAEQLVLIGGPEEIFFAFTTNKKDIFYMRSGKWRKGDLSVDVVNEPFLQPREMAQINERMKKWLNFFDKADKEMERIKGLKDIEKNKSEMQIEAFKNVIAQGKVNYDKAKQQIEDLRNEAKNTYDLAIQKVRETENIRGWSLLTDNQEKKAERNLNMREEELDEMDRKEYNNYAVICNTYNNEIDKEEARSKKELDRLEGTIDEENARVTRQVKQNILQGW